jgi:hypothetical protein
VHSYFLWSQNVPLLRVPAHSAGTVSYSFTTAAISRPQHRATPLHPIQRRWRAVPERRGRRELRSHTLGRYTTTHHDPRPAPGTRYRQRCDPRAPCRRRYGDFDTLRTSVSGLCLFLRDRLHRDYFFDVTLGVGTHGVHYDRLDRTVFRHDCGNGLVNDHVTLSPDFFDDFVLAFVL